MAEWLCAFSPSAFAWWASWFASLVSSCHTQSSISHRARPPCLRQCFDRADGHQIARGKLPGPTSIALAALGQVCHERNQLAQAQRHHIGLALRAFLRLEVYRLRTGISWFEAKTAIVREAVRAYLAQLLYTQTSTA